MKETKVYVNELPESCFDCHCAHYGGCVVDTGNVEDFEDFDWSERRAKHCPLIDIKTHDRELVKKVCEKIYNDLKPHYGEEVSAVVIERVLSNLQKECEK